MRKIGILGGAFDPPHIGHFILSQDALSERKFYEVWFLLSFNPPHRSIVADFDERKKMLELGIFYKNYRVDTTEKELALNKSYTVKVLQNLKEKFPDYEFEILMGEDQFSYLHKWYKPELLFELSTVCVLKRKGNEINSPFKDKVIFLKNRLIEISSKEIRARIKKGQPYRYLVPPEIYDYINKRNLYR